MKISLRSFLRELEEAKDILHIKEEVSVKFEIARILQELDGGPAVFFERVKESRIPVVGNVCGSRQRILRALEIAEGNLYSTLLHALKNPIRPRIVEEAPVKEVVEEPRLTELPILTHYEKDAGPYITAGIVVARSPDGRIENLSFHRLLILDDRRLVIRIVPFRHLHQLHEIAKKAGKLLDVAIVIGSHPTVMLASCLPAPFGLSEYDVANSLLKGELTLTKCEETEVLVPAESEIVLEGQISDEETPEGPFADLLGTYDIVRDQPIIEVARVMRRKDCIYQAILPVSLETSLLMGIGRELNIWSVLKDSGIEVKAVSLTPGSHGWLHGVISIKKRSENDVKKAIEGAFSAHPSLKHVIIVDEDIDVFDHREVEWAVATRFRASRDLTILENVRGSTIDPSSEDGITDKLGINATIPPEKPSWLFERAKTPETPRVKEILRKIAEERQSPNCF